ncbi:MAG: KilA-N domain-containing protein [Oscillospiraceae bacterium]|nr:KilA-N domain-containing protein [Oscillospiraceae bacterium]
MDNQNVQLAMVGYIDHTAENELISQRVTDGYINATAMCKAAGKEWKHYRALSTTKPFLDELSSVVGQTDYGLIQSYVGGVPRLQGTWVHPQVAVHLAQWLSPKFAVMVTQWVMEWMQGGTKPGSNMPYHLRRYLDNAHKVQYGHFSVLNEIVLNLIGPMEQLGYTLSGKQVPDISLGKLFSSYLKSKGYDVKSFPEYMHRYEDGREYPARAYPNELLPDIRKFFVEVWLKDHSIRYFTERDPEALPYLQQFLALPNYREIMGYIEENPPSDFDKNIKKLMEHKE